MTGPSHQAGKVPRLALFAALAVVLLAQVFVDAEPHFVVEEIFGFPAIWGFVSCVLIVFAAKGLDALLRRPDDHYGDRDD